MYNVTGIGHVRVPSDEDITFKKENQTLRGIFKAVCQYAAVRWIS
jgi:hypothetical protein